MSEATVLFKGPCPKCGSSDACATYSDGHEHCFSMGCDHHTRAQDGHEPTQNRSQRVSTDFTPMEGECQALPKRGISEETCKHFGYTVGADPKSGRFLQLAPYTDAQGRVVAQKWRSASKDFGVFGKLKDALPLFGQHLWRDGGKKVVITEGEIDAMSVSQMQGNKWPVVSVPNGAQGAKKALQGALEWLEKFDEVILMFDQDEPGRDAVAECAPLFTPGRCKVAKLPLKDANELLKAGRGAEIIDAIWGAKAYRPDGVVSASDLVDLAGAELPVGYPWFLDRLTELTHGRRDGEVYALGAGTGVGKTDWFTQSIAFDVDQGFTVGALYLEQSPVETMRRVAGKRVGKLLHVPGAATDDERRAALKALGDTGRFFLYDNFGAIDWETVKGKLRYMIVGLGCKMIYLDHLTAMVAQEEDEKKAIDSIMAELAGLAKETGAIIHFISHLATPEGRPHEEGGRVTIRHFRGSRAIGFWSYFMFGLERNQQADEEDDVGTVFRVLKDRNTGQATGKTIRLRYDPETGLISQADEESPFGDATASTTTDQRPEF
jgi:twinkle protein